MKNCKKAKKKIIGVELFAGAGGLSLGALMAGIDVRLAIEKDPYAAATYKHNHPNTELKICDVKDIEEINVEKETTTLIFGGAPCQGFSTSNQKTRNKENPSNWLFKDFVRLTKQWQSDWILFENVRGIVETEKGFFLEKILSEFKKAGYTCSWKVLNASDFGIPQTRSRFFLVGSKHGKTVEFPQATHTIKTTVKEAIEDLPDLENGAKEDILDYPHKANTNYAKSLRGELSSCTGHLVSRNSQTVLERYAHIPQGGNWENIPEALMKNYRDRSRCHTGIYHRLKLDSPAVTIGNYRKAMLIHPCENRGISVREAARIQSFPDSYEFKGSIGFQQQQVSNAVPPLLAKAVFEMIYSCLGEKQ
jgi:DNA (cytosine-5)-methyltransferase 1